jgi:dihydrofolate reductase
MRKLIYTLGVTLDGYTADRDGSIEWSRPDDELFAFHVERARGIGQEVYGRRLYEDMFAFWPTVDQQPDATPSQVEFAKVWKATPKVVFSSTLESVNEPARLIRSNRDEDVVAETRRLKAEDGGDMDIAGATIAAPVVRAGLVDEYWLFTYPVLVGGGTPFFPKLDNWVNLRALDTREFATATLRRFEVVR